MMTITYIFYVDNFSTYNFNLDSHNNNHIFIMFLYIFNIHILCIYVSYHIIFKIKVSTYRIRVVSDTHIVPMHHRYILIV